MTRGGRRDEHGFALLLVLWTLVLLSLIVTGMVSAGRIEAQLASNLRAAAVAEAAADGAVHQAVLGLLRGGDLGDSELRLPGAVVALSVADESGKVNPNAAEPDLLAALLRAVGADARTADAVAAAIADWRFPGDAARAGGGKAREYRAAGRDYGPPGAPFRSLDEVGLVLGMTPALLGQVMPYLSLYAGAEPDLAAADPAVRRAIQALTGQAAAPRRAPDGPRTVTIVAAAVADGGGRFARRAVVALRTGEALFRIMEWDAPAG